MNYDQNIKIIFSGDSGTGKSSIIKRYAEKKFSNEYSCTIGADLTSKIIIVDNDSKTIENKAGIDNNRVENKRRVRLQIWDTAGQERFKSLAFSYYRNANIVVLVYDVTSQESFYNLTSWIKDVEAYCPRDTLRILLGNKCDIAAATLGNITRQVTQQQAQRLCDEYGLDYYFETSAKTGAGIEELFNKFIPNNVPLSPISQLVLNDANKLKLKSKLYDDDEQTKCC